MADGTPHTYRALVLCPMRNCPACQHDVLVKDDHCTECGSHIPKPPPRIPRPRRPLQSIPAMGFGLEHAAAAMTLDVAAMPGIN
ncbi:MAG TPA: hypothetical protein VG899_04220 [Mycobacteriales bacterium]|nr:hypothetical protein [Mycobacteriales bacterium]HWA65559.1 hypothetical protein [Mycobacteriales bacterium]